MLFLEKRSHLFKIIPHWLNSLMKYFCYILLLISTTAQAQNSRHTDSLALIELYVSTDGANWRNSWEINTTPMDEWAGVTLENNRVTELNLASNSLVGYLPVDIGNLDQLEVFNLSFNLVLGGPIPSEIGNWLKLKNLNLRLNALNGDIPSEIGNLTDLEYLDLSSNELTGKYPSEIGSLTNLTHLDLAYNELTGVFPNAIQNLTKLVHLDLSGLELTGSIPSWIGNITTLKKLFAQHTTLSGNIPEELGQLSQLEHLILNYGAFEGAIPSSLGNLSNLISLQITHARLTGEIPKELGDLLSLKVLNFNYNSLEGELPGELGELTNLRLLAIQGNLFHGIFPSSIALLENLTSVYASANSFTEIPDFTPIIELSNTTLRFYFTNNQLSFKDIIKNLPLSEHGTFGYRPQKVEQKTMLQMSLGDRIVMSATDATEGNKYLWFKNGQPIYSATSIDYELVFDEQSEGHYVCEVSNDEVQDLFVDFDGYYLYDEDNTAPNDLSLSDVWLPQDSTTNQFIAKISVVDKDPLDEHAYYLVNEGADDDHFYIKSDSLFSQSPFDFNTQFEYALTVGVTDSSSASYQEPFKLYVDGGREMDSLALVSLFENLNGDSWRFKWDIEFKPISEWHGVTMNDNRVFRLNLGLNNLTGELPTEIGWLSQADELNLSRNQISGQIPKEVGLLKSLSRLYLGDNQLSGSIPSEIAEIDHLFGLYLSRNNLTGSLPKEFEKLSSLSQLNLPSNQLDSIPRLTRLRLRHQGRLEGMSLRH